MAKRKRRAFTQESKAEAVRTARESGKSVAAVARDLDLTETALRSWVRQAEIDAGRGAPGALTTEEREELGRLRRENRTLRMERDILNLTSPTSSRAAATSAPAPARSLDSSARLRRARGPLDPRPSTPAPAEVERSPRGIPRTAPSRSARASRCGVSSPRDSPTDVGAQVPHWSPGVP